MSSTNVSLRVLFLRALNSGLEASQSSDTDVNSQDLVISSLRDLHTLAKSIEASGIFSSNETLEDVPNQHLPYLSVDFIRAEMESRVRTVDRMERMRRLRDSQRYLRLFFNQLRQYDAIPDAERKLYSQKSTGFTDMATRRELKIAQFKQEKELRSKLEALCTHRGQPIISANSGDVLHLIASLLPSSAPSEEQQQIDDDDEIVRDISLVTMRVLWSHSQNQIKNLVQELDLLENAPPVDAQPLKPTVDEDVTWRLDPSVSKGSFDGKGPLLDSSGRPLRPFTILPGSASSQRSRLQSEVFRPDHRLPTMTMDEYLEEEERRGNIVTGGGPQSQFAPTRSEQLILDSEMDGTVKSEMKGEEKRQEDEIWARYTDLHPKGEGNTMNRG